MNLTNFPSTRTIAEVKASAAEGKAVRVLQDEAILYFEARYERRRKANQAWRENPTPVTLAALQAAYEN